MPAPGQMSANARKQHEEDIERLVKCRLRSEIEARKAVESTMKRAVHEARELKKELVLLRKEKEEILAAARKSAMAAPGSGGKEATRHGSAGASKDKQSSNKAAELKLKQQIQTLTTRIKELESDTRELQQQVSDLESENQAVAAQSTVDLSEKDREIAALQDELKKTKLVADETKRKCQKMLKEKKEEAQRALQENEQLARCAKTLQGQLALLPQLKKQLEHAKEKRADVAEVWQKKLEQRDQAFLREEEASKRKLAESAAQVAELVEQKHDLQTRLEELEGKLGEIDSIHQTEMRDETQRHVDLETLAKQLEERLLAAEIVARKAEQAEVVALETQKQETRLRQLAEDAADAVEARAEKAERELVRAQQQLSSLEEALQARGVTLDYLLKQQTPVSVAGRASSMAHNGKTRATNTLKKPIAILKKDPARITKSRASATKAPSRILSRRSNNNDEE